MTATPTSYNPSYRYGHSRPKSIPFRTGQAVNVGDFCYTALGTRTVADGATTNTSTTVTSNTALFTAGDVGAGISGTGIPASTTIVSVQSSTSVTISAAATATGTGVSLTITPSAPNTQSAAGQASVLPAQTFPWTTNLATTQQNFVAQFTGISGQQYAVGYESAYGIQDGNLRIDTAGVFDFTCASATWNTGDLFGLAQDGANSNLAGQTVVAVTALNQAVGRVVQPYPTATTTVRGEIFPAFAGLVNAGALSEP